MNLEDTIPAFWVGRQYYKGIQSAAACSDELLLPASRVNRPPLSRAEEREQIQKQQEGAGPGGEGEGNIARCGWEGLGFGNLGLASSVPASAPGARPRGVRMQWRTPGDDAQHGDPMPSPCSPPPIGAPLHPLICALSRFSTLPSPLPFPSSRSLASCLRTVPIPLALLFFLRCMT